MSYDPATSTSISTSRRSILFGMLGVFSEFERAMIRDRVMAGLDRARSSGKRLGRPRTTPFQVQRIRAALGEGRGVREDGATAEGICRQGQRGQALVGDGSIGCRLIMPERMIPAKPKAHDGSPPFYPSPPSSPTHRLSSRLRREPRTRDSDALRRNSQRAKHRRTPLGIAAPEGV